MNRLTHPIRGRFVGARTAHRLISARWALSRCVERVRGIEPLYEAWEAAVLPLNYTRSSGAILARTAPALYPFFASHATIASSAGRPAAGSALLTINATAYILPLMPCT